MDRSVDASTKVHLVNIHGWRGYNNPWMAEGETDSEYSYINLLANPERYTGYKVPSAQLSSALPPPCLVMGPAVHSCMPAIPAASQAGGNPFVPPFRVTLCC